MNDPYRVLGVPSKATDDEVTQAYRRLAKKNHPDVNPGDKAAERRMQEINAAYTQIKDARSGGGSGGGQGGGPAGAHGGPGSQRGYGGYGEAGAGWGAGNGPFGGWRDPFSDIFGEGWARQQQQQGQHHQQQGHQHQHSQQQGGQHQHNQQYQYQQQQQQQQQQGHQRGGAGSSGADGPGGGREWQWQGEWRQENGRWQQQWRQARQEPVDRYVRAASSSIVNGDYQQAINYLMASGDRDAEWHYYCAIANAGVGNRVTAVRLARTAVQMDPDCDDYRVLLHQFEQGGYAYQQAAARQGFDMRAGFGVLMQCLLFQVICYCCCSRSL